MENRRSLFDITFDTDNENSVCSDSDISFGSESELESDSDISSDNETVEEICDQTRWKANDRSDLPKRPFTGPDPGPTIDLDPNASEFDFFELFFPVFLIELLCRQTNLYAEQKQRIKPDANWRPVEEQEMKAWLGIRVFMSILEVTVFLKYL